MSTRTPDARLRDLAEDIVAIGAMLPLDSAVRRDLGWIVADMIPTAPKDPANHAAIAEPLAAVIEAFTAEIHGPAMDAFVLRLANVRSNLRALLDGKREDEVDF